MVPLPSELRSIFERAILNAREAAENAARAALTALAVGKDKPFTTMNDAQRELRNALHARARQLGNGRQQDGIEPLVEEVAYKQWHRMLFARFLSENNLLIHPKGVPVTLSECAELAPEEGAADAWELAARYASAMLPGVFRSDDPAVQVRFAPEGHRELERILDELLSTIFTADDALGWAYQFWQTKKKAEVNRSERKIGGAELPAVTQLFTEHYMVQFLLENSLGAWWAIRHPKSPLLKEFQYLRFLEDGTPAAGTFSGWPERAAEITVMDPCCGSGHFLVAAFEMLRRMRMEEEGLAEVEAADAVLRDNLFGLELDARCTQIAAFSLVLATWKIGGYRVLSSPNIACSGIPVVGQLEEWTKLAGEDEKVRRSLERLHNLFRNAPDLGSLINPADVPLDERMFMADYQEVEPLLEQAMIKEQGISDPAITVFGAAAHGVAKAAELLAGTYTLVVTNVPYLVRGRQNEVLRDFCATRYPESKNDLATAFLERCEAFLIHGGCLAVVSPQSWLFQSSYKRFRSRLLREETWNLLARLGPSAFDTIGGAVVNVALLILTHVYPDPTHILRGVDVSAAETPSEKERHLCMHEMLSVGQRTQLDNPDSRVILDSSDTSELLCKYATSVEGLSTGDLKRYVFMFWEVQPIMPETWELFHRSPDGLSPYSGARAILRWEKGSGTLSMSAEARIQGHRAWGKHGVLVNLMNNLNVSLYAGHKHDKITAAIIPSDSGHLSAIWHFCKSPEYVRLVRQLNPALQPGTATLVKVPFDLARWQKVTESSGPPPPKPFSKDPSQWLFEGHPASSTAPLQVAVARLLGYRWPQQKPDELEEYADTDGIVCLPAVGGEQPAAERLRALLAVAFGDTWSPTEQERLLAAVDFPNKGLNVWLRDGFFAQHCRLFHNRPFIWHIWDGRKDGFSTLVNYHRLDAAQLDRLIYTYLGYWITKQRAGRDADVAGADGRLVAAIELQKKLEAIRDGEPPYDIYVRWKPLQKQPIGWNPDLNDGVRLNIRPFVTAGVLRSWFTINWNKDRGKNPDGSERLNDRPYTRAEKLKARQEIVK